jgi:hypothetical protein
MLVILHNRPSIWNRHTFRTSRGGFRPNSTPAELLLPATCVLASSSVALSTLQLLGRIAQNEINISKPPDESDDEFPWMIATAVSWIPGFNWLVRDAVIDC